MTVSEKSNVESGTLFVVATPIGNLEDITLRAVRILGEVDFVASEDTRHTRKLLSHLSLSKPLISYYKDKEVSRADDILKKLLAGENGALVSDAGTPAVSDPGAILVSKCFDHDISVIPIPGPSSLTAALSVSGFAQNSFVFLGFLPAQQGKRCKMLTAHAQDKEFIVFFETAKRIRKTLADCHDIFGDRQMVLAREITKIYEELLRGPISEVLEKLNSRTEVKGECVVLVSAASGSQNVEIDNLDELLRWYRDKEGSSLKDAVQKVSSDLNISRSKTYKSALRIWHEDGKSE
ncbi:MAG: 16S rRNA (cytidine(1402)-2'-O)-methyltransferase [Desulfobulbaceae bacterium]|uniref:Ribosomal RNA small subunit methyltransferase I n=1 Tax=Candidatus Desulfobia pelagia TaxID=2841692 RepID=A0A8J6NFS7_9BACT|nr:16S rRNA (cytidine(1402)-2'-O)-methyltransferase [Candidatus Desulfobia pelagia]